MKSSEEGGEVMSTAMTEQQERLFLLFKSAIDAERKAQDMYKKAMELTEDDEFRDILEGFYQDEVRHERKLMDQYNKITRKFSVTEK
jgi:rubrerythrin